MPAMFSYPHRQKSGQIPCYLNRTYHVLTTHAYDIPCQLCYFPLSWRAISPVHTPAILRGSLVPELGFGVHGASRSQSSFKPVAQRVLRFSVLGSNSVTKMGVMLQKGATNGEECMSRSGKNSVLLVLLGWFLATLAFAQGGATGAITGTVQDPTGAVVANAEVRIVNQDTGVVTRTAKTDANGSFTAPLLPAGTYTVTVSSPGFQEGKFTDIGVRVTETTRMSARVAPLRVLEKIEVQAEVQQVETTSATTGQAIDSATIRELPLATQNFEQLLTLSTGAQSDLNASAQLGRGNVRVIVNGQREDNNNYLIEGISATDYNVAQSTNVPLPNPDVIQEFKVQTSLYDASQGRNGGGNVNAILKSGSREFHGDAYEYFRNDVLNANEYFLNAAGQKRPPVKQNIFGASLGGPVGKEKISARFFFSNSESLLPFGAGGLQASLGGTLSSSISATDLNFPYDLPLKGRFLTASETHLFSPTLVNEFRFGYVRIGYSLVNIPPVTASDLGIVRPTNAVTSSIYKFSIFGAGFQLGPTPPADQFQTQNNYSIVNTASWVKGVHVFRFGGEYTRVNLDKLFPQVFNGQLFFFHTSGGANAFQKFLIGAPDGSSGGGGVFDHEYRPNAFAFFGQDDWKVRKDLTLNLGLRVEMLGAFKDNKCHIGNFDPNLGEQGQYPFIYLACVTVL